MKPLCESELQSQNLMDLQFHHNFRNQLPYSPFQEESIAKSMEDMIPNPNSVTRPISRLDSLMSELINESEESVSCQPLIDPYIPNSTDWTHESFHFGNPDSISQCTGTGFNVDSGIEKKSGKDTRVIIEPKSEMELLT